MKSQFRKCGRLLAAGAVLAAAGCVEIEQEIRINHNGSGTIVEKVAVTARGMRLFEGMARDAGQPPGVPFLLSDAGLEARRKALGGVALTGKKDLALPDGRKQVEAVYAFTNINAVTFWILPTFNYKEKQAVNERVSLTGSLRMRYVPEYESWGRVYRETVYMEGTTAGRLPAQKLVSPAERQKVERVLPIFLDMLSDFRMSIVMVAPIESFEEPQDMVGNVPVNANRVTVYEVDGRNLVAAPGFVRQLIMNEVVGGEFPGFQQAMPGVFSTIPGAHGGYYVRFMKSTIAPAKPQ